MPANVRTESLGSIPDRGALRSAWSIYMELGKARLSGLVVATAVAGYLLPSRDGVAWAGLLWTVLGTGLAAMGANALNQWWERSLDARMERTRERPLPAGRLSPARALAWGLTAALAGPALLWLTTNIVAAGLALLTAVLYVLVYTPLKTRSPSCTLIGAVCGALPPMIGVAAATGGVGPAAWMLGALLFVWQIPHFLALAWLYRDDYARGGFRMLPMNDPDGRATCQAVLLYTLALTALAPMVTLTGLTGWLYAVGSLVLGAGLLVLGVRLNRERTRANARRLFLGTLVYLPALLALMAASHDPIVTANVIQWTLRS